MKDPVPDFLRDPLARLPRELPPGRDLWPGIEARLTRRRAAFPWLPLAAAAMVALAATAWWRGPSGESAWTVAAVSGAPRVGHRAVTTEARLQVGQWLETDAGSAARVAVGAIGEVRLEPNSRLRLVNTAATDHRLELARGRMSALIWAPPRLFFVETPAATAVDLGCAYTLSVDDEGAGELVVTSGYVALEHGDRAAIIPAGLMCYTRPGSGPGTPFATDATDALRDALVRFDRGDPAALGQVLRAAGEGDGITLWHLLDRAPAPARGAVFDRLAALHPPPERVTREGIIAGDAAMRKRWAPALGLWLFDAAEKE